MHRVVIALAAGMALAGCVSQIAEGRVRTALVEAGVAPRQADCMAERMTDRLTIGQLRRLEALKGTKRTLADYVAAVRRVGDPEVIGVTTSSAALCAVGIAPEWKR